MDCAVWSQSVFENRQGGGKMYIVTGSKKLFHSSARGQVEISVSY
jgi:hypothetical protein